MFGTVVLYGILSTYVRTLERPSSFVSRTEQPTDYPGRFSTQRPAGQSRAAERNAGRNTRSLPPPPRASLG